MQLAGDGGANTFGTTGNQHNFGNGMEIHGGLFILDWSHYNG
jgi:hypothetical protein